MVDSCAKETREIWRVYLIFRFFSILLHSTDLKGAFSTLWMLLSFPLYGLLVLWFTVFLKYRLLFLF